MYPVFFMLVTYVSAIPICTKFGNLKVSSNLVITDKCRVDWFDKTKVIESTKYKTK